MRPDKTDYIHFRLRGVVGPVLLSDSKRYFLTMIHRTTRWPDAVPLQPVKLDRTLTYTIAHHHRPRSATIHTPLWDTTATHPQSNGSIES